MSLSGVSRDNSRTETTKTVEWDVPDEVVRQLDEAGALTKERLIDFVELEYRFFHDGEEIE